MVSKRSVILVMSSSVPGRPGRSISAALRLRGSRRRRRAKLPRRFTKSCRRRPIASTHGHGASTPGATGAEGPSEAALMVCGDQPKERVRSILDLDADPHTIKDSADSTFTCTYHLAEGDLAISVQEAANQPTALKFFDAMQALAKDATPIAGLANLGFPAYESADGSAVFHKDS
ncbi:hypothetical protein [Arthrobacter sp. ZGTC412]|uniref:hypothetical protein n=1 Tax=Arthrobacter sp. ZGTC412 TaxID=2058900 RepID=UPI0015E34EAC|nr:hypothetical protein [Arthrobacter sp. ZGTC412]